MPSIKNNKLTLYNGVIYPVSSYEPVSALVVEKGHIVYLGDSATAKLIGEGGEKINLKGKTVFPGFVDSHVHLVKSAINNKEINFLSANSSQEILDKIREKNKDSTSKFIIGWGMDPARFDEKIPSLQELDEAAPDKPVLIIRRDSHSAIINSQGLKYIGKDPTKTVSSLLLKEEYNQAINHFYNNYTVEDIKRYLKEFSEEVLKKGVTFIHALEGGFTSPTEAVNALLRTQKSLPIRTTLYYQTTNIRHVIELNLKRIGGCILVDGSFSSHTAALKKPYADSDSKGFLYFEPKRLQGFVIEAHSMNLQIALHAIGDAAIEEVLKAYTLAFKKFPNKNIRHRIEHFELPSEENINQAAKLGVILSMQPTFEYLWGGKGKMYQRRLGERYKLTNPFRKILDKGLIISGGSDSSVTPIDPFLGIYSAVNNSNIKERTTLKEAITMFTLNGWHAAGLENKGGSLEIGKVGDLVVLNEDPFRIPKKDLLNITPLMTICRGKIVYQKSGISF